MTHFVTALDDSALNHVAAQTHDAWGGTRDRAAHRARIAEQIARGEGTVRYAGLVDGGTVLCSLKRHALALDTPGGAVMAVGIGAVFTPQDQRGRGMATSLLREVVAEARREGRDAALLFSDIEPSFYERLGFVTLSSVTWSCRVDALPSRPAPTRWVTRDLEQLCTLRRGSYRGDWLRAHRSPRSWRYGAWLNGAGPASLFGRRDAPSGYVVAHPTDDDVLWVDDAGAEEPEVLWACLADMAAEAGAGIIAGWMRADLVGGPFVARRRQRCIPMVAGMDRPEWRSHFSSIDHF